MTQVIVRKTSHIDIMRFPTRFWTLSLLILLGSVSTSMEQDAATFMADSINILLQAIDTPCRLTTMVCWDSGNFPLCIS